MVHLVSAQDLEHPITEYMLHGLSPHSVNSITDPAAKATMVNARKAALRAIRAERPGMYDLMVKFWSTVPRGHPGRSRTPAWQHVV